MVLNLGSVVSNRYRIDALLGQGGCGAVYRVWDLRLDVPVALKENLLNSPASVTQFGVEARLLVTLNHPNLPRVTDFFSENGSSYLVMDFIDGSDVRQVGKQPVDKVLLWADQICDALTYLHTLPKPVIHRDIKPDNIRLDGKGKPYLVDFGISKVIEAGVGTQTGARGLTPGFAPIEQYGIGGTDFRTDVYSLGATLYFALSGNVPPESVQRVGGVAVPPIDGIPVPLYKAIEKAMAIKPDDRYQTIEEFREAIKQPVIEHKPTTPVSREKNISAPKLIGVKKTIQEMIDSAPSGGEIILPPGEYHESFTINKPIKLRGDGPREMIKIYPSNGDGLVINNKRSELSHITFIQQHKSKAYLPMLICIKSGTHEFQNCSFSSKHKGSGIFMSDSTWLAISDCEIFGFDTGIHVSPDSEVVICDSSLRSCHRGCFLNGSVGRFESSNFKEILHYAISLGKGSTSRQPKKPCFPYLSMTTCNMVGDNCGTGIFFFTTERYAVDLKNCFITKWSHVIHTTSRVAILAENCTIIGNSELAPLSESVVFIGENNDIQQ